MIVQRIQGIAVGKFGSSCLRLPLWLAIILPRSPDARLMLHEGVKQALGKARRRLLPQRLLGHGDFPLGVAQSVETTSRRCIA